MTHLRQVILQSTFVTVATLAVVAEPLPRSTPEAEGISSWAILDFVQAADRQVDAMNSFMVVRHGRVVAEGWWAPYAAESPHSLFSLSKSFTSTAVGLAVHEGKLSLDDPVLKFFPDDAPTDPSQNLRSMRVRDLLRMATGHQTEPRLSPTNQAPWTQTFLAQPVPHKPGTHFLYNTAGTYMQSAIVQKATGQTVLDYLRPRLFEPLGIENPEWGTSPQGISLGGYGLSIRTEDIAKFGELYRRHGTWHGRQLVPEAWVQAATSLQVANGSNPNSDWDQGYGYQYWRCRHNAYRGDGAFGQFCVVMPDQDAVVAITSGTKDMQAVLNLVWDKLLPAMNSRSLPADERSNQKLKQLLTSLSMPQPQGSNSTTLASAISGKTFAFSSNDQNVESVSLETSGSDVATLRIRTKDGEQRIPCGYAGWQKGRISYGTFKNQRVAASGAWTAPNTYTARVCFYETPTYLTLRLKFDDEELAYSAEYNVGFGATKLTELKGRRE